MKEKSTKLREYCKTAPNHRSLTLNNMAPNIIDYKKDVIRQALFQHLCPSHRR